MGSAFSGAKGCYRELFQPKNHVRNSPPKNVTFSRALRRDGGVGSLPRLQPLLTLSRCSVSRLGFHDCAHGVMNVSSSNPPQLPLSHVITCDGSWQETTSSRPKHGQHEALPPRHVRGARARACSHSPFEPIPIEIAAAASPVRPDHCGPAPSPFACAQRPPTLTSPSPDIPISSPSPFPSAHSITIIITHHILHGSPPHDRTYLPPLPPLPPSDARINVLPLIPFVGCKPAPPRGAAWAPAHLRRSLPYSVRPCGWRTSAIPPPLEPALHMCLFPALTCCRRLSTSP